MRVSILLSSCCCWWARFLCWTLFDASKYSFGILICVCVCVCVRVRTCVLCITQFSWTITLSKAWFGICCHTQATTVMMTRSDILLVWTWELVMFISWITQHTFCKCAVLWIIVRLNFDTVWFWLVTNILEKNAVFFCSVTNCLCGHLCGSRKEMSHLCG